MASKFASQLGNEGAANGSAQTKNYYRDAEDCRNQCIALCTHKDFAAPEYCWTLDHAESVGHFTEQDMAWFCDTVIALEKENKSKGKMVTPRRINLDGHKLTDKSASILANMLKVNQSIAVLNLADNFLDNAGVISLADALKHLDKSDRQITLYLEGNPVGDKGALAMAEVIKRRSVLKELVLGGSALKHECNVGKDGLDAISDALKYNITMERYAGPGQYMEHNQESGMPPMAVRQSMRQTLFDSEKEAEESKKRTSVSSCVVA